ncbi:MAG: hypothetical protein AB7N80_14625 [Bdellovibrionales bacterium]
MNRGLFSSSLVRVFWAGLIALPSSSFATESTGEMVFIDCNIPAALLPEDHVNTGERTMGAVVAAVGGISAVYTLSMHGDDVKVIKKSTQILQLMDDVIKADDAVQAANRRLQEIIEEMRKIGADYNLDQRISQLKAERAMAGGKYKVGPTAKDLFAGTNAPQSVVTRYNGLRVEQHTLAAQVRDMAGSHKRSPLHFRLDQAVSRLIRMGGVHFEYPVRRVQLGLVREQRPLVEQKINDARSRIDSTRPMRRMFAAGSGAMVLMGTVIYFSDEISELLKGPKDQNGMTKGEVATVIKHTRCMAESLDQIEVPDAQPEASGGGGLSE